MIVLLGCVKSKLAQPATAADLYTSPLWRARRRYAERSDADWYILSAKHGLVKPGQKLAPYEMALTTRSLGDRRDWGERVVADLAVEVGDLRDADVELHAGAPYREAVWGPLEKRGAAPLNPLAGTRGIGEQLSWYGAQGRNEGG